MAEQRKDDKAAQAAKLKVVNLFGAPGVGKSATRSGLFWLMKIRGISVEEVSEYAKYLVLAKRLSQLENDQLYVLAKQHHKMHILNGSYEFAVTDSPLMLAGYYCEEMAKAGHVASPAPDFVTTCLAYANSYDNLNLFLTRDFRLSKFEEQGRLHNMQDSERIDKEQREFLARNGQTWVDIHMDACTPYDLLGAMLAQVERHWPGSVPASPALKVGGPVGEGHA